MGVSRTNKYSIIPGILAISIFILCCGTDNKTAEDSQSPSKIDPWHLHKGLDISLPLGEPALAAMDGIVVAAGPTEAGNRIIIWHPTDSLYPGYYSGYWYVNPIVEASDLISEGQIIGYSDGSGKGIEPHLHFEIRDNYGEKIDPATVLPPPPE